MPLKDLPVEIFYQICTFIVFDVKRLPASLLVTNKFFYGICLPLLHADLVFKSPSQLQLFSKTSGTLLTSPRSITVLLAGGTADFTTFPLLHDVFRRCLANSSESSTGKLRLQKIAFCLNSHTLDRNCVDLYKALSLVDPDEFTWTSPDPVHHFSIAIVPQAATYLFKAMESWRNLRHLKLTRLAFPSIPGLRNVNTISNALGANWISGLSPEQIPASGHASSRTLETWDEKRSATLPHIHTIELNQVVFLDPAELAHIACASSLATSLRLIHVTDAYQGSIWGPRVRIVDVERAAMQLAETKFMMLSSDSNVPGADVSSRLGEHPPFSGDNADLHGTDAEGAPSHCSELADKWMKRVREIVQCEAKVDRIMGGDRVDANL